MRFLFDRPTRNALRWNMEVKLMVGPYIKIRLYMHVFVFNLLLIRDDLFFVIPRFK